MRVRSWRSEKACIYAVFPVVSSFLRHKKRVLLHSFRLCHFSDILFVNFTSPQSLLNPHKSRIYKVFSHLIPCCPTLSRFVNYLVNIHAFVVMLSSGRLFFKRSVIEGSAIRPSKPSEAEPQDAAIKQSTAAAVRKNSRFFLFTMIFSFCLSYRSSHHLFIKAAKNRL